MAWTIKLNKKSEKQLEKLDKQAKIKITDFLVKLERLSNPRKLGHALKGDLGLFWRYRVGDFRLLCHINDNEIAILVVGIGHRKNVYS